ncbi:MAG TPA: hypothetical protein VMS96_06500 [Terriglobales bacterium]|nr:hypothetical protein [Terriglobales bacterium]
MNFLAKLLRGIAFIPAVVTGIEGLFGSKSGTEKKESVLSFVGAAISMTEAITNREILDEGKFREGLGKIIDGTVQCLNASTWAKQ